MNVFLLPGNLYAELERMMNSYWWGYEYKSCHSIIWYRWEYLYKLKKFGGLGFKNLREFNLAMLSK